MILENKDSSWACKDDEIVGFLRYNCSGKEFMSFLSIEYDFIGINLEGETKYSLIYYADKCPRETKWGGDNPGFVIDTDESKYNGGLELSGSVDLDMDLPHEDDENYIHYNYGGNPDYYAHTHGAKIWLVLTDDLTNSKELPLIVWNPDDYLFKTDLIWYEDTDS